MVIPKIRTTVIPEIFYRGSIFFFSWIPAFAGMTHHEILTKQNEDTLPQDDTHSVILKCGIIAHKSLRNLSIYALNIDTSLLIKKILIQDITLENMKFHLFRYYYHVVIIKYSKETNKRG